MTSVVLIRVLPCKRTGAGLVRVLMLCSPRLNYPRLSVFTIMLTAPRLLLRTGFRLTRVLKQVLIVRLSIPCGLVQLTVPSVLLIAMLLMLIPVRALLRANPLVNILEFTTYGGKWEFLLPA